MIEDRSIEEMERLLLGLIRQHFIRLHTLMDQINLHRGQPPLLHELWQQEGCTQSELAGRLNLAPATVTKMLQRMEQAGLLERRPDPQDQRISRVFLTQAGWDIRGAVQQREQQVGGELLAGFSAQEKEQLAGYLIRMRENLQKQNRKAPPIL